MNGQDVGDHLTPMEEVIGDEGLFCERDDDEDALRITFKSEGERYFVVGYRDDPTFLMLGSGWALPSHTDVDDAVDIANELNVRKKFVKVAVWSEPRDVLFTIELCVMSAEEVRPHFGRLLDVLRDSATEFFNDLETNESL